MYISGNFMLDHLFFENQGKINIKNSTSSGAIQKSTRAHQHQAQ
jgi:hypothetical protein